MSAMQRRRGTTDATRAFVIAGETLYLTRRQRRMARNQYRAVRAHRHDRDFARSVTRRLVRDYAWWNEP